MRELTLEHLAPYLPYRLKGIFTDLPGEMPFEAMGITIDNEDDTELVKVHGCPGRWGGQVSEISNFKPILRPLSDLMPYENGELDGMGETNDYILIRLVDNTDQHCDAYDEWRDSYFDNPVPERILQAPYEVFQELVKEHYDVFDLISCGLAIDINTISHE